MLTGPISPTALSHALVALAEPNLLEDFLLGSIKSATTPLTRRLCERYPFENQTKFRALQTAIEYNNKEDFLSLLNQNAPLTLKTHARILSIVHFTVAMCRPDFLTSLFQQRTEEVMELLNTCAFDDETSQHEEPELAQTALTYALNDHTPEGLACARVLIDHKANVNQSNEDGSKAIEAALMRKIDSIEALHLLKKAGAVGSNAHYPLLPLLSKNYALSDKIRSRQIQFLAEYGEDLNTKDNLNLPLMAYTIRWKNFKSTRTLIFLGADSSILDTHKFRTNIKEKEIFKRWLELTRVTQMIAFNCQPLKLVAKYEAE